LVAFGGRGRVANLEALRITDRVELFDAACLVLLAMAYEALRLASTLDERLRQPRSPRAIAALFLPAAVALAVIPGVVRHAPRLLEAAFSASLVLTLGASAAVVWCTAEDYVVTGEGRRRLVLAWAGAMLAAVVVVVGIGLFVPDAADRWADRARDVGFELIPRVLAGRHL
ncbi:MAG: hypothetical protein AAFU79_34090, partial [Myxococcota bacterium]